MPQSHSTWRRSHY